MMGWPVLLLSMAISLAASTAGPHKRDLYSRDEITTFGDCIYLILLSELVDVPDLAELAERHPALHEREVSLQNGKDLLHDYGLDARVVTIPDGQLPGISGLYLAIIDDDRCCVIRVMKSGDAVVVDPGVGEALRPPRFDPNRLSRQALFVHRHSGQDRWTLSLVTSIAFGFLAVIYGISKWRRKKNVLRGG